jgi:hypothetical protein
MQASYLDDVLWAAGATGELLLLGILIGRRIYRTFPIFCIWIAFVLLLEPTFYWLLNHASARTYYQTFFALNFPQYLLEACVLLEVASTVLQPVRKSLPKGVLFFVAILMVAIGTVGFLVAAHLNAATLAHTRSFVVLNTAMAILRLVTFLLIAAFSQVLGLGWKNHVLQLASGLAFYSAVTLIVELAHSHLRAGPSYASDYYMLAHFRVLGYLCALYYWCFCFARQEAPRKEFNSKMSDFLVSMSGMAKQQQSVVARKHR